MFELHSLPGDSSDPEEESIAISHGDLPHFKFNDHHLDKLPRLTPVTVNGNVISTVLNMRQLREDLLTGESVRLPFFSVNESDPFMCGWRFELRLYPSGQFGSPDWFSVYLVLIECPYGQYTWATLNVNLTVKALPQNLVLQDAKSKMFDWNYQLQRWIRLGVPLGHIKYRSRLAFSVSIVTGYNSGKQMVPIKRDSIPKGLMNIFTQKSKPKEQDCK